MQILCFLSNFLIRFIENIFKILYIRTYNINFACRFNFKKYRVLIEYLTMEGSEIEGRLKELY